jgi:hypothetical protein
VDETRRSSEKSFKTPRSTPDLNLKGIGWVERLGEEKLDGAAAMELGAGVGREGSGRKLHRNPSPRIYIGRQSGGKSGGTGPCTGRSGGLARWAAGQSGARSGFHRAGRRNTFWTRKVLTKVDM